MIEVEAFVYNLDIANFLLNLKKVYGAKKEDQCKGKRHNY